MIEAICTVCGTAREFKENRRADRVRCRECQAEFQVGYQPTKFKSRTVFAVMLGWPIVALIATTIGAGLAIGGIQSGLENMLP